MKAAPPGWEKVRLGELLAVKHGFAFKGEHFSDMGKYLLLTGLLPFSWVTRRA